MNYNSDEGVYLQVNYPVENGTGPGGRYFI